MVVIFDKQYIDGLIPYEHSIFYPFIRSGQAEWYNEHREYEATDHIYCCVYWNLSSIESLLQLNYREALLNKDYDNPDSDFIERPILTKGVRRALQHSSSYLLLYNHWESRPIEHHTKLLKTFSTDYLELNADRVFYSVSNYMGHMRNQDPVFSYDWGKTREIVTFNQKTVIQPTKPFQHKLISLNFRGSVERLLYCYYLSSKHLKDVNYSYLNHPPLQWKFKGIFKEFVTKKISKYYLYDFLLGANSLQRAWVEIIIKHFRLLTPRNLYRFYRKFPKVLDGKTSDFQHQTKTLTQYLQASFFIMIFETNSGDLTLENCQVSEKTYMGIKLGMPFIVFTTKGGILTHLHALGFKTFSSWIDESYDQPSASYRERYMRLLRLTDDLCALSDTEINEMHQQMQATLDHNLRVLRDCLAVPNYFELLVSARQ